MSEDLIHGRCGKKVEAVEVFTVTPQVRYVLDDEDGRFYETNVADRVFVEEYVCQECGQVLSDEEVERLEVLIADDER